MRWLAGGVPRVAPAGVLDAVLAVALSVGVLLDVGRLPTGVPDLPTAALALVCTASVSTRRLYSLTSAFVALAAAASYQLVAHDPRFTFEPYAVALTLYMVGRTELRGGRLRHRSVLVVGLPACGAMAHGSGEGLGLTLGSWALFAVLPYAVGALVERRARTSVRLATQTELLLGDNELRARSAAVQERLHVARELHDVVAHCLTEMVIQAGAARIVLHKDMAAARHALVCVAQSGRTAAADLGRVVGSAIDEGWQASRLMELLEAAAHTGVEVDCRDIPRGLSGTVDATGFRVVQEALTNAARHAPGAPVNVRVRAGTGAVDIEIVNGPVPRTRRGPGGPGFGLVGMQERVTQAGGSLDVGPTPTGGYAVHVTLPWESPPGTAASRPWSHRSLGPRAHLWVDLTIPAGWIVALAIDALTSPHRAGPPVANVIVVVAMAVASVLRRRRPVVFLGIVGVLALCLSAGLTGRGYGTLTGFYTALVPTYCLGSWAPRRTAAVAFAAWAAVVTVAGLVQGAALAGLVGPLMAGGLATAVGLVVGSQRELNRRLAISYAMARTESDRLGQLAADRERIRIAEQLHAPVAHLVKRMVDTAEAAISLVDTGNSAVIEALDKIEHDGRDALIQMRHVLGALRATAPGVPPSYDAPGEAEVPAQEGAGALGLPA